MRRGEYGVFMRRVNSLLSTPVFLLICVTAYTAARFLVTFGKTPVILPDSIGYETLRLWGENDRFWSIPLVYSLVDLSTNRVLVQSMIGCLAWIYFAYVVQAQSRFPRFFISVILTIGLTPQVVRFDVALLSESLGISFTVIAVAATLNVARNQNVFSWLFFVIATTFAAFTRPTHLFIFFVIALIFLVRYVITRRKSPVFPLAIFLVLSIWGINQLKGNSPTSNLNFYTVLQQRIIKNDADYKWFVEQGMPDIPGVRESRSYTFDYLLDKNVAEIVRLPAGQQPPVIIANGGVSLAEWVRDHGWRTYFDFLREHPVHVAKNINRLVPPTLSPGNDAFLPLDARTVMLRELFGPWWLWMGILISSLLWSFLFTRHRREVLLLTLMTKTGVLVFLTVILCSAVEIQRHATSLAVLLRVLALAALALALQKRSTPRDESSGAIA